MPDIYLKDESYRIMGACFAVYNEMGCGFLEAVYQECLAIELTDRHIPFQAHEKLHLSYKGKALQSVYIPDFVCFGQVILEIKAIGELNNEHRAQVHNYLKATNFKLGLLVNFGAPAKVQYERIVR
ncbi:MAG: GxxExxY protein [Planctomycetota bacterium]